MLGAPIPALPAGRARTQRGRGPSAPAKRARGRRRLLRLPTGGAFADASGRQKKKTGRHAVDAGEDPDALPTERATGGRALIAPPNIAAPFAPGGRRPAVLTLRAPL